MLPGEVHPELVMVEHVCNPGKLRQDGQKFKAGLGNM